MCRSSSNNEWNHILILHTINNSDSDNQTDNDSDNDSDSDSDSDTMLM